MRNKTNTITNQGNIISKNKEYETKWECIQICTHKIQRVAILEKDSIINITNNYQLTGVKKIEIRTFSNAKSSNRIPTVLPEHNLLI